ncbi:MAG: sulfotransferase family 2 domain-containing protein [Dongiaceae bacterium]
MRTRVTGSPPPQPMVSGRALRKRISRYHIAEGDGPIDRIKIGCAFGTLKAAYWITALVQDRRKADLDFPSIVSNKYRFAFCGIPKVATKSIRAALLRSPEIAAFTVNRGAVALAAEGDPYRHHYRFSFVRNPWSRVVSCYRDKILIQRSTVIGKIAIIADHPGLSPSLPFDAFVEWLCSEEGSDRCADRHWMSQHKFLMDAAGSIVCDFVGRLENIETDFKTVCDAVCLPPIKLPHGNRSTDGQGPYGYRDIYNDRTRKLVGQRYERDVDAFKYVF